MRAKRSIVNGDFRTTSKPPERDCFCAEKNALNANAPADYRLSGNIPAYMRLDSDCALHRGTSGSPRAGLHGTLVAGGDCFLLHLGHRSMVRFRQMAPHRDRGSKVDWNAGFSGGSGNHGRIDGTAADDPYPPVRTGAHY